MARWPAGAATNGTRRDAITTGSKKQFHWVLEDGNLIRLAVAFKKIPIEAAVANPLGFTEKEFDSGLSEHHQLVPRNSA